MTHPIRWGILGTGAIAKQFARGLAAVPGATLAAVGSRAAAAAQAFATEFQVARAHGSYAALAADPAIDAIYIATPHPQHADNTVLCLAQGKHVLCEKPFAVNRAEGERMIAAAKKHDRLLMEAMWTRFLPATTQVCSWLAAGAIGEARMVQLDFGFRAGWNPQSRLLDPALAGGALLDVGCYTLAYLRMIYGTDMLSMRAEAHIGETGVDEQIALLGRWHGGRLGVATAAVRTNTNHDAWIYGTTGRIQVPSFWCARKAILHRDDKPMETSESEFIGNGYNYQAVEFAQCLAAGRRESGLMPLSETLTLLGLMDDVRRQIGLTYPMDALTAHA